MLVNRTMPHSIFWWSLGHLPMRLQVLTKRELSDRWQEGLQIREWVEGIWSDLEGA